MATSSTTSTNTMTTSTNNTQESIMALAWYWPVLLKHPLYQVLKEKGLTDEMVKKTLLPDLLKARSNMIKSGIGDGSLTLMKNFMYNIWRRADPLNRVSFDGYWVNMGAEEHMATEFECRKIELRYTYSEEVDNATGIYRCSSDLLRKLISVFGCTTYIEQEEVYEYPENDRGWKWGKD